jgi:ATP-dependent exoDNAse (exonuclease V) beta subunit
MSVIADQAARERALDPARSFIVQAPAGSGKTDLLVKRYRALIERAARPEEVLAITFTRKAAAEMRKRVLESLPDAADKAHRLRIMTIDAFCASLTRQMPVLAKFGAQPETLEDAWPLYREAATRTIAGLGAPVERFLAHLDNNAARAAELLASMLARRDQWLRATGNPPSRAEIEQALARERARLLANAQALLPDASPELAAELLTKKFEWRKKNARAQQLADNEPLRLALAALLEMPPASYSEAQWGTLDAILQLLPLAAAQLKVVFAGRGECDFTEIAQGAVRALGTPDDPTDLMLALDHRIHHILVDEFQDTSFSQWELLRQLTAGWEREEGAQGASRTLFLVGDPMQSIYRFRGAEVALFLHARHEGLGNVKLEPIALSTNFRSQARVVEWVNATFPSVMPQAEDESAGAVPYASSTPKHAPLKGEACAWHLFEDREAEGARVAELAAKSEGTCAILVRNRSHLDAIVPALKAAGLRFRAIEIEQLGEKQAVQDLYALTRALAHPADRVAWLAVLRAPWCGLTLADLHRLCCGPAQPESPDPRTIWELMNDDRVVCNLSEDGRKRLVRAWEPLGQAMIGRLRGTLRDRVEGCWLALGGPACAGDRTDLEDAEIYLCALEEIEQAGDIEDPGALAEALEKLFALPDLEAEERLQVMTIHKAKGLEFDTVIVPCLDRWSRRGDPPALLWKALPGGLPSPFQGEGQGGGRQGGGSQGGGRSLLLAPIHETGAEENLAYEYLKRLEREAEDTEAGRLLYVAATRAKQRIHLLGCVKLDEQGAPREPNKSSLLAKLWPFAPPFPSSPRRGGADAAGEASAEGDSIPPQDLRRLPSDWSQPPAPEPAKCKVTLYTPAAPDGIEFVWVGETRRHAGTVVHRWLQRIAEDALEGWTRTRIGRLRARFLAELRQCGVPAAELERAAKQVAGALANAIEDERGRWVLGPHPAARSEHRLRTPERRLVVDRVFTDASGARWVVDFKTGTHSGTDLEGFLDRERERYRPQLERYAAALGATRRGLYFPLLKGWREW